MSSSESNSQEFCEVPERSEDDIEDQDDDGNESTEGEDDFEELPPSATARRSTVLVNRGKKKMLTSARTTGKKTYLNNLLLTDAEGNWFYAFDDPQMKGWLGADLYRRILRFQPNGLIETHKGGEKRNLNLYKCSMMHGRHMVKCVYTEKEYEDLAMEAHLESRLKSTPRIPGARAPFQCVHCKRQQKDKNRLSWHKITGECKADMEGQFLKMYPTWEKSQFDELARILFCRGRGHLVTEICGKRFADAQNTWLKGRKKEQGKELAEQDEACTQLKVAEGGFDEGRKVRVQTGNDNAYGRSKTKFDHQEHRGKDTSEQRQRVTSGKEQENRTRGKIVRGGLVTERQAQAGNHVITPKRTGELVDNINAKRSRTNSADAAFRGPDQSTNHVFKKIRNGTARCSEFQAQNKMNKDPSSLANVSKNSRLVVSELQSKVEGPCQKATLPIHKLAVIRSTVEEKGYAPTPAPQAGSSKVGTRDKNGKTGA